ncbi:BQ2448_7521 [Microbotryum intermedium]|uniref:BQ2448_7521 protein n=1 Tax=Microbotryum intermedium TaxID=269621 RepID=A0A238FKB5_9BASI|nr:BQ2448_7521 [Microbotryum intermedium]
MSDLAMKDSVSSHDGEDHKGALPTPLEIEYHDGIAGPLTRVEQTSSLFTVACAGFALISDGLQNNIMSLTNVVFGQIYGARYTATISTRLSNALTVGTIFGQIIIGILCDRAGRKYGIVASTISIVVGVILAASAHGARGSLDGFFWMFCIARGLTGFGVGGEYPSSSASAAEAADERSVKSRGPLFIMVTNFMLSFGTPFTCILYLIVFQAAGGLHANLSTLWRTVFGISVIPPPAVFIFRLRMINSRLYRKGAIQHRVPYVLMVKFYWRTIIGTAGAWFLYDFVTFPNGVFSGTIIASIVHVKGHELLRKTAEYQLLLGIIALPGVFIGAFIVNRLGRRNLMMLGFSGYLIVGLSVGLAYNKIIHKVPGFIILYGLMQPFGNLGPGNTLGLVSSESYATSVRDTLYGFSAAIGKTGAVIGTQTFTPIRKHLGPRYTFIIAACAGLLGILVAFFFVRNDLEGDLSEADAKFTAYLRANVWEGAMGTSESIDALVDEEKQTKE